jgi:hypothetical protein
MPGEVFSRFSGLTKDEDLWEHQYSLVDYFVDFAMVKKLQPSNDFTRM